MTSQASLLDLIGRYPVLAVLSSYLSTVDLLHLGLTARRAHSLVLGSLEVFAVLKRQCLCDGHGLRQRLADSHAGVQQHAPPPVYIGWCGLSASQPSAEEELYLFATCDRPETDPLHGRMWEEAEIEVRLCARRCGVNVCEECRDYPRLLPDLPQRPNLRPHLEPDWRCENVLCLCPPCDAAMEEPLQGQFLRPRCDCDRYRRWVCRLCVDVEAREAAAYLRDHSSVSQAADKWRRDCRHPTKSMPCRVDAWDEAPWFYCPCGARPAGHAAPLHVVQAAAPAREGMEGRAGRGQGDHPAVRGRRRVLSHV